ncbi:MAG TPA: hypothetical protein VF688_11420 [Allosphingosinicella sp.]
MKRSGAFHFLATGILTSAGLAVVNLIWIGLFSPGPPMGLTHVLAGLALFWAFSFPFVIAGGVIVGLPLHAWLRRAGRRSPLQYLLTGLLAGAATAAILGSLFLMSTISALPFALYGAAAGGMAALIWWNLAIDAPSGGKHHA